MDSQHASSGEHPKIIGPPNPEHKLQTILEAVGKTVAAIEAPQETSEATEAAEEQQGRGKPHSATGEA
jgi:hypothetical protein